jgi:hypothetical protein
VISLSHCPSPTSNTAAIMNIQDSSILCGSYSKSKDKDQRTATAMSWILAWRTYPNTVITRP